MLSIATAKLVMYSRIMARDDRFEAHAAAIYLC